MTRPPGAANPESAHNKQRTTAREQVPSNTSRRPDGRVRARQRTQPLPATEQPPSGWTSARPEGTQPLPATNSRRPDGRVCAPQRPPSHATHGTTHRASTPVNRSQGARTPYAQHNTPSEDTGEQEPRGPGHRTRNTTHRARTPVNRSQGAQDTAHATQHTERAHR